MRGPDEVLGYELSGNRAVFKGDYKLLSNLAPVGDGQWHLFNIAADPGETTDLSAREPARRAALEKAWDAYASDVGVVLPNPRIMVE